MAGGLGSKGSGRTGRLRWVWIGWAALAALASGAPAARAFDFFDGKLQIHGAFEEQVRGIARDMSLSDNLDLTQWYNVLNIQADVNIAPNGWGPFDVLHSYIRVEGRFDCVWTEACRIFPSANAFGDAPGKYPQYKTDGHSNGWNGATFIGNANSGPFLSVNNEGRYTGNRILPIEDPRTRAGFAFDPLTGQVLDYGIPGTGLNDGTPHEVNNRRPARIDQLPGFVGLFPSKGSNGIFNATSQAVPGGDPAYFYFLSQADCKFGVRQTDGPEAGAGSQILGPSDPQCKIQPNAALRNKPNPFNSSDWNPIIPGNGSAELPGRPASAIPIGIAGAKNISQGVYYPSAAYQSYLRNGHLGESDQNFNERQLMWNHGGSQEETYELKEAYLDMEFFDSRLWVRVGKQNIVWGKTELFRTTDQFNPQDLALASLPSLEESRIALNSIRAVWSFYDVGPADDVRLEVAANLDKMNPADIGKCGEPYTPLVACNKTTGLWAHGLTGFGLAGESRPQPPWEDIKGLESGARLEFRLSRFSFQISDFWGYDDFPYAYKINDYSRSVDPFTGRPLKARAKGPCTSSTNPEPSCLNVTSNISANGATFSLNQANQQNVRNNSPLNQQLFATVCATSIGFNSLDKAACGQTIFNSLINPLSQMPVPRNSAKNALTLSSLLANALAGNVTSAGIISFLAGGATVPFVPLNVDPCDPFQTDGCPAKGQAPKPDYGLNTFFNGSPQLNNTLTDEQEAMLGCGHFWGISCETDGIDLLNAEASFILQSFIGYAGVYANPASTRTNTMDGSPQPGTTNFYGPLPATRFVGNGRVVQLPGARGPADSGYNPLVDGCVSPAFGGASCAGSTALVIPASFGASAGQQFRSEGAALSFNLQLLVAALSSPPSINGSLAPNSPPNRDEFDINNPYSTAPGQCSWAQPQFCSSQVALLTVSGMQRNVVKAGGSNGFGRRDFVWASGAEAVLKYPKRNVFGFSMDFAEDVTKSNWGIESAWVTNNKFTDNDKFSGIADSDTFNITVSVDRPTFINFLNQNRTFFFNSQWFFQYVPDHNRNWTDNGPFNVLGTFTIQTGYFQDRLLPSVTFVYDVLSNSGAALPEVTYRFTENFSGQLGINWFWGRQQYKPMAVDAIGDVGNRVGRHAYDDAVENALAVVRERDEIFMRLRYTF